MNRSVPFLAALLLCTFGSDANARETTIGIKELPASVRDSMGLIYPDAKILRLTREASGHEVVYEAELLIHERQVDALFNEDGSLREEEARIPTRDLPTAIQVAVDRDTAKSGSILRAERLSTGRHDPHPRFEVLVSRAKILTEFVYSSSGALLKSRPGERSK
jgi:hypothetical protein